jgi:hypothetical protein
MRVLIVVFIAIAAVVILTWLGMRGKHPEQAADHADEGLDTTSDRFHGTADRPAGPDAEDPIQEDTQGPP